MDFRPSQEHEMFRAAVARFAREELAKHVKTMEETDRFASTGRVRAGER